MYETKGELKQRLKTEGKWDAFVKLREDLKADGKSPADARDQALLEVQLMPVEQNPVVETNSESDLKGALNNLFGMIGKKERRMLKKLPESVNSRKELLWAFINANLQPPLTNPPSQIAWVTCRWIERLTPQEQMRRMLIFLNEE